MKDKLIVLAAGLPVLLLAFYFQQPTSGVQPLAAEKPVFQVGAGSSAAVSQTSQFSSVPVSIPKLRATLTTSSAADFSAVAAKLALSTDNGNVEFIKNTQGQVIRELDQDPTSPSFKKPLSDYGYQNGKVNSVTRYEYNAGLVTIYRLQVAYDAAGNIVDFRESARTE